MKSQIVNNISLKELLIQISLGTISSGSKLATFIKYTKDPAILAWEFKHNTVEIIAHDRVITGKITEVGQDFVGITCSVES